MKIVRKTGFELDFNGHLFYVDDSEMPKLLKRIEALLLLFKTAEEAGISINEGLTISDVGTDLESLEIYDLETGRRLHYLLSGAIGGA